MLLGHSGRAGAGAARSPSWLRVRYSTFGSDARAWQPLRHDGAMLTQPKGMVEMPLLQGDAPGRTGPGRGASGQTLHQIPFLPSAVPGVGSAGSTGPGAGGCLRAVAGHPLPGTLACTASTSALRRTEQERHWARKRIQSLERGTKGPGINGAAVPPAGGRKAVACWEKAPGIFHSLASVCLTRTCTVRSHLLSSSTLEARMDRPSTGHCKAD